MDIEASLIEMFEEFKSPEGKFYSVHEVIDIFGPLVDKEEVKFWFAFPPADLSYYLEVGRNKGIKGIFYTPLREAKAAIQATLANSQDTNEARVEDVTRFMRAWSILEARWRKVVFEQLVDRHRRAAKNGTLRSVKVLQVLMDTITTFDLVGETSDS